MTIQRQIIAQQGEAKIYRISEIPAGEHTPVAKNHEGAWIVSHSEQGHHHVIDGGDVMERTERVPEGMKILYALLKEPTALRQDAHVPHAPVPLEPGLYEIRIQRESFNGNFRTVQD